MKLRQKLENKLHQLRVEAHAIWLAARDPRTPFLAQMIGILVAGYALSPIDLIPDFVPVIGLLDDLLIVPLGLWLARRLIPDALFADYLAKAEAETRRPVSKGGMIVILLIWAGVAAMVALYLYSWRYW